MRARRTAAALTLLALLLAGCGAGSTPAASGGSAQPLTIVVRIADGQVSPNGEKVDAALGQPVVLQVTSDEADEIHAHTGGDGYELAVPANTPTTGTFTPTQAGSFEVESHHLDKVIVVLDVR